MAEKEPTREELAERVRRLEKELREFHDSAAGPPAAGAGGVAEGLLASLGKLVPGLQKLIDTAGQMPEFHDRLTSIDEEIKRRFKEQPLSRASAGIAGALPRRQMGIPPSIRQGRSQRGAAAGGGAGRTHGKQTPRGRYRSPDAPRIHISPETPAQLPVDVFDEGSHLAILAEAPGLQLKHIALSLEETVLLISIDAPQRKGLQRIELPCAVTGKPKASLAKGILHVHLKKAKTT